MASGNEDCNHDHSHQQRHGRVNPRRGLDAADVQQSEDNDEENLPNPSGNARGELVCLACAPYRADEWVEHVVHHHAPAGHESHRRVHFLGNVSESGSGAGVSARHPAVTDAGEQHRNHGNQDCRDHVSAAAIAEHAKHRHGRDRLNDDDAVENQIPKGQRPPKARRSGSRGGA